jgi:hypothetical protein
LVFFDHAETPVEACYTHGSVIRDVNGYAIKANWSFLHAKHFGSKPEASVGPVVLIK